MSLRYRLHQISSYFSKCAWPQSLIITHEKLERTVTIVIIIIINLRNIEISRLASDGV